MGRVECSRRLHFGGWHQRQNRSTPNPPSREDATKIYSSSRLSPKTLSVTQHVSYTRAIRGVDYFGKFLVCWFSFNTLVYFWSGRFLTELEIILISLRNGSYWWAVEAVIGVFSGGLAVFLIVPLLLRGSWLGFLVALIYWGVGRVINPLLYLFPRHWLGSNEMARVFCYTAFIFSGGL
jgi:hypothetical protein